MSRVHFTIYFAVNSNGEWALSTDSAWDAMENLIDTVCANVYDSVRTFSITVDAEPPSVDALVISLPNQMTNPPNVIVRSGDD